MFSPAFCCQPPGGTECCRGAGRTCGVEASLARHCGTRAERPALRVVPTDFDLARRVGSILHGAGPSAADIVDAHSVAVASMHGRAVIVTADPDDILRLASAVLTVRIVTRTAR
jgi:hypothetical protein